MFQHGLIYAFGPADIDEGVPASAFSRGDLLVFDSSSSLSKADVTVNGYVIAGVALADSNKSFRDQVPYILAGDSTVFWSNVTAGVSNLTAGALVDFDLDGASHPTLASSGNTARAIVERPLGMMKQTSGTTRILIRLVRNSGLAEFA